MKLAIMQPYFLPYIGYFQAIDAVDKYILYSNLNFSKRGWSNRNRILLKDGSIMTMTVPLLNQSSKSLNNSIKIVNNKEWKSQLLKTIYFNYKGAFYFDDVYPYIKNLLNNSFEYLYQLNGFLIENISDYIGIDTKIEYEDLNKYSDLEEQLLEIDTNNYSQFKYMKKTNPEKRVARILEICRYENASTYINAIGGQTLYSKEEFAKYGVDLQFIKMHEFRYPQFSEDFEPNLSIVDVLMHNGSEKTKNLIKKYSLI